ncbi:MAG: alkaline phosphatase family protein, partial [Firmicutes bacterium]|nr:alkaline phosphatase family protein [Bacillota bacterium]
GVTPEVHGLTNSIVSEVPYDVNSPVPSVFRVAHNVYPDAQYAAFCNWNPIYNGIIEHNLGVVNATGADNSVTDHVCEYLENHEPKVLFVQFDQVDGAGHGNGYGTPNHLKQIEISDAYIGRIYDMYVKRGLIDDTLFIVSADHGGTPGGSHGGITEAEKRIFIGFAGETVNHITLKDLEVRDIAAVTVCALGIDRPKTWSARVPMNLFSDVEGDTERPEGLVK